MTPRKQYNEKLAQQVIKALESRQFTAQFCPTAEAARHAVLERIAPEALVGWGGSATVNALGVKEVLRQKGQRLCDRELASSPAETQKILKQALTCDVFLMSSNAITADGQLVNMDGQGNRLAALIYGPDKVIIAAGMNKVVKDVPAAVSRVRNLAAPMNAQRFGGRTPCTATGMCADCLSPDSICCNMVITRLCKIPGRIHVILIGEDMGM